MTEHQIALARRAVAAPGWRWLPGMAAIGRNGAKWRLYMGSGGVLCAQGEGDAGGYVAGWSNEWAEILGALPDLSDDLTALGLLALVRERWGTTAHLVRLDTNVDDGKGSTKLACWWALAVGLASRPFQRWDGRLRYIAAPTEVEVLILALEVAP